MRVVIMPWHLCVLSVCIAVGGQSVLQADDPPVTGSGTSSDPYVQTYEDTTVGERWTKTWWSTEAKTYSCPPELTQPSPAPPGVYELSGSLRRDDFFEYIAEWADPTESPLNWKKVKHEKDYAQSLTSQKGLGFIDEMGDYSDGQDLSFGRYALSQELITTVTECIRTSSGYVVTGIFKTHDVARVHIVDCAYDFEELGVPNATLRDYEINDISYNGILSPSYTRYFLEFSCEPLTDWLYDAAADFSEQQGVVSENWSVTDESDWTLAFPAYVPQQDANAAGRRDF